MFLLTWPIILSFVLLAACTSYVLIKTPKKYYLKFSLIPVAFFSAIMITVSLYAVLGRALPTTLPNKFTFLGYNVVIKDMKKIGIEVWIQNGPTTKLYVVPYNKQTEKDLEQARGKQKSGGVVIMEKRKSQEKKGIENQSLDDPYDSNIILPHQMNPKSDRQDDELEDRSQPPADELEMPVVPKAAPLRIS